MLCFTHDEASTHEDELPDLAAGRGKEFAAAATILGITQTEPVDYPDSRLSAMP